MPDETTSIPEAPSRSPSDDSPLFLGQKVSHYRLTELIGRGGMGEVYVAHDETLGRRVALKSIRGRYAENADVKNRFLQEARILSRLENPNICQIYDYLETDNGDFLVLELIRGETLRHAIEGAASRKERIRIAIDILNALIAAHKEGVVHRDLKPSNVMITESGQVKVLDFGLARSLSDERSTLTMASKLHPKGAIEVATDTTSDTFATAFHEETAAGSVLGTPGYMSPEQARGLLASPASDMYTFGLILRELLSGRRLHPPDVGTFELYQKAFRAEVPETPGLPKPLHKLVTALASSDHRERPSAEAASASLAGFLARPRRAMIAGGIVLAMLGLAKYGYDVTLARNEAERAQAASELARGQAEELAAFMLDDLLDRLDPIGRTDLLGEVTNKTLLYFENLPKEIHDRSPERLAKTLIAVGYVEQSQGNLDGALTSYERALHLTEPLAESELASPETLDQHSRALSRIGLVQHGRGDLSGAEMRHRSALEIRRRLHDEDPGNPLWASHLAQTRRHLGDVFMDRNELEMARQQYESALAIRRRLHEQDPGDADRAASLSLIMGSVGEVIEAQGDLALASSHFEEALAIDRRLHAEDPGHSDRAWNLSHSLHFVGSVLEARGDLAAATMHFEEAVLIDRQLHELDPSNADWAFSLSFSLVAVGGALAAQDILPPAREHYREAVEIERRLYELDPNNADWEALLAYSLHHLARLELASGRDVAGRSMLVEATDLLRRRAQRDELDPEELAIFAGSLLELGRIDEAQPYLQRLYEIDWHLDSADQWIRELIRREGLQPE